MEEKKAKEVKMNSVKTSKENTPKQKLSYDQLNDACNQLFQQNQQLRKALQEMNAANMFKRLDYLFKVVELGATFKDADFVNSCMDEIKEALTVPDDKENGKED
jgi:hypothetical protein